MAGLLLVLNRGRAAALARVADQVNALDRDTAGRFATLEVKIEVFWRTVALPAAAVLHSPHPEHARRDILLERLMAGHLELQEAIELAKLVEAALEAAVTSQTERLAAGNILGYLQAVFGVSQ